MHYITVALHNKARQQTPNGNRIDISFLISGILLSAFFKQNRKTTAQWFRT